MPISVASAPSQSCENSSLRIVLSSEINVLLSDIKNPFMRIHPRPECFLVNEFLTRAGRYAVSCILGYTLKNPAVKHHGIFMGKLWDGLL